MPVVALGQTDEIQVYDAEIAPPGIFNLMIHNNFTPKGRTAPDYGFLPLSKQFHEVWAATDYSGTKFLGLSVETGVGYGLTAASDKWTLKLMLSRDLNVHPWRP